MLLASYVFTGQYQQCLQHGALIPKLVLACVDNTTKSAQAENGFIRPFSLALAELPLT